MNGFRIEPIGELRHDEVEWRAGFNPSDYFVSCDPINPPNFFISNPKTGLFRLFIPTYEMINLTFGQALEALQDGKRVARAGWNGKNMYLWYMAPAMVKAEWCREPFLKALAEANGGEVECLGTIRMKTADDKVLTGWLASQSDMVATDWVVVE